MGFITKTTRTKITHKNTRIRSVHIQGQAPFSRPRPSLSDLDKHRGQHSSRAQHDGWIDGALRKKVGHGTNEVEKPRKMKPVLVDI